MELISFLRFCLNFSLIVALHPKKEPSLFFSCRRRFGRPSRRRPHRLLGGAARRRRAVDTLIAALRFLLEVRTDRHQREFEMSKQNMDPPPAGAIALILRVDSS